MVLRRSGSIHRKISMNSNIEKRKSKKFKLRVKAKKERRGAKPKTVRIHPDDEGIITPSMIRSRTRKNPLANVKLSNKKRNKTLKQKRYMQRDKEQAAKAAVEAAEAQMETEPKVKKTKSKKRDSGVTEMDCD
ncbi:uncharacterized protein LOC100906354 [Galendromus occidentalis]|uniref:Uncharacterized protein LOC100906354 n=1 Tax=Galendromus occidentalis TaxID=34638 RepID=A0AAJ6QTH9_9ACAR|nr:uncharacterized protein LOC100906354 [Galendromus occidentalis]